MKGREYQHSYSSYWTLRSSIWTIGPLLKPRRFQMRLVLKENMVAVSSSIKRLTDIVISPRRRKQVHLLVAADVIHQNPKRLH